MSRSFALWRIRDFVWQEADWMSYNFRTTYRQTSAIQVSNVSTTPTVLIFSYGTLQNKKVQISNFGRELTGREDALPGYVRRMIPIVGESYYANAEPSDPEDTVLGSVFEITEQELAAADEYEATAAYHRISVTLRSGDRAWVYVRI